MAACTGQSPVVIWEWMDPTGCWVPYASHISNVIEQNQGKVTSLDMMNVDPNLAFYTIDMANCQQVRKDNGTRRSIRRQIYSRDSPAAKGVMWQWLADYPYSWQNYGLDVATTLETAFTKNQMSFDLSVTQHRLPYTINLQNMTQTRNETGRARQIQRVVTSQPYHPATNTFLQDHLLNQNSAVSMATPIASSNPAVAMRHNGQLSSSSGMNGQISGKHSCSRDSSPSGDGHKKKAVKSSTHPSTMTYMTRHAVRQAASSTSTSAAVSMPATLLTDLSRGRLNPAVSGMTNVLMSPFVPVMMSSASYPHHSSATQATPSATTLKPLVKGSRHNHTTMKKSSKSYQRGESSDDVIKKFVTEEKNPPDEDCCICCDKLASSSGYDEGCSVVYRLGQCSHMFHRSCLCAMYESAGKKDGGLQCPTCKVIYGQKIGNCPPGRMEYAPLNQAVQGYPGCGTIIITYNFSPGIQTDEHPNPGRPYHANGFPRTCYLPDNEKGRKVLRLLLVAWERRLTFTVGNSVTTGAKDTIVWNEIHHKTEFGSNYSGHGYPDPNYLDNVLMELSLQGVTDADDDGLL